MKGRIEADPLLHNMARSAPGPAASDLTLWVAGGSTLMSIGALLRTPTTTARVGSGFAVAGVDKIKDFFYFHQKLVIARKSLPRPAHNGF